ncbi:MAG TPA: aldo/keto reductase, partial [Terriglobia bacterium]|nr:aldo/keto reductase [Terriglobia bacterium]
MDCQIRRAIVRSIAAGINVLDTSANYRDGRSERAVGDAVRTAIMHGEASRDELFIASKGGYLPLAP